MSVYIRIGCLLILLLVWKIDKAVGKNHEERAENFDWTTANTSIWLSAAAYCGTDTYLIREYKGYSKGFIPMHTIVSQKYDVQGYIGIMPDQQAIYVPYRGSSSYEDFIGDLNIALTTYAYCEDCEVHTGFLEAMSAVKEYVLNNVRSLLAEYEPTYKVVVTGHSLGAALATFTSVELVYNNVTASNGVILMNFGSPRVGNKKFAVYASDLLVHRNRVTHHKDIVPHLPWYPYYEHILGEWYEDGDGVLRECSGYEDPNCSFQWYSTNVKDHMVYLGLNVSCDAVTNVTVNSHASRYHERSAVACSDRYTHLRAR